LEGLDCMISERHAAKWNVLCRL